MSTDTILFSMFLIFTGAAVISTLALYTRQSLLVTYLLLGILLGPYGLKFVDDSALIKQVSDIGILFLLFLVGLNLHPQKLFHMLRRATFITLTSSVVFAALGFTVAQLFGYNLLESLIIGSTLMFSSTIIGLKLLPTTILHHRHTGEIMISILLLQDLLAILILLLIKGLGTSVVNPYQVFLILIALPVLLLIGYLAERFVLGKLLAKFDYMHEYIFLLSIGWCLGMAELSYIMGFTEEVGAFIAGVALAASPISFYIAENLKPLRDFFLVLFFFSVGASFNIHYLPIIIVPAAILALIVLIFKPIFFHLLLKYSGESPKVAWEIGVRLGQASEFSLLVSFLAWEGSSDLIGDSANYLIEAMTMLTFFVSSYWVVLRFPTPLGFTERMRKD